MRALFFLNSFSGGGAESVCLNLAEQLHELDIESDFVTIYDTKADYSVPDYIHVFSLGIEDKRLACYKMFKLIPRVNDFISRKKYVLISAHLQPSQLLASLTRSRNKCLYVMHVSQHLKDGKGSWFYKTGLRFFLNGKKVVTVSKGLKHELIKEYGIPSKNITAIYNPCNAEKLRAGIGLESPHKRQYILVMGRLEEQKNPLLILDLYYKGRFYTKYDLIYLGKGSLKDKLSKRIHDYNLDDKVFPVGFQRCPERWITNASLLLSCSKQEGLPMNLVEALICGTPVVAADCPHGPKEILIDELAGYLIYPEKKIEECIAVIWSALHYYPEITQKYYAKFDADLITRMYMHVWGKYFA